MRGLRTTSLALTALAIGLAALCGAALALAQTRALLQVDAEGRGGNNRHRLALLNEMPDGREVMVVVSCRVDDPRTFGVALDFGAGAIWAVGGEQVAIAQGGGESVQRMSRSGEYLALGGSEALGLFHPLLAAGGQVSFAVRGRYVARFDLGAVSEEVRRFRELCPAR